MENRLESSNKKAGCPFFRNILHLIANSGGERGIRTLDTRKDIAIFETAAFDHSAISPTGVFS